VKGFFNKVLVVNLSERTCSEERISDTVYRRFLGGKGLGVYLMLERNRPGVDPFSPENSFVIGVGPVNDSSIWGSSRYGVFTKSPLTGFLAHSYSGGKIARPISRTGYDAVVLEGKSEAPVYLEITDRGVMFHDAGDLWGLDTYAAEDAVLRKTAVPGAGTLVIGPAGENLVRFANVTNNYWRCAGRTGAGAVLGSKKVKALVFHGQTIREMHDPEALRRFSREWLQKVKGSGSSGSYKKLGTAGLVSAINAIGAFPTRYWHQGRMEGWENISGERLHADYSVKAHACRMCMLACGRMTQIGRGVYAGLRIEGPEYETIYAFGGLCLIDSLDEIIYLNDLCDRLGLDTITAGNLAAFAIEASLKGRIKEKVAYGDARAIARLMHDIARKEDLGSVLAQGIVAAAKEWGMEEHAVHVKGMEPGGYDPRVFKGMGLAYATSDRGACHLRSTMFRAEISGLTPPDRMEGKAEVFVDFEDRLTLQDALILCRFYRDFYLWDELAEITRMTTGMEVDKGGLRKIASNIQDAARTFNIREGLARADDTLPSRFFDEGIGPRKSVITREQLERLKDDYYRLRGWSREGSPPEISLTQGLLGEPIT
jgi:aldehyde:ferredoxin oxidoreductase